MVIPDHLLEAMAQHARDEFPNEACGLLAGHDASVERLYPVPNADASPVHYTLDARGQLEALTDIDNRDLDLIAIYHSHTHTRAYPSATDIEMARVSLAFYPDTMFVILSLSIPEKPDVRAFLIGGDTVTEIPICSG